MNTPNLTTAPSPILYTDLLHCSPSVSLRENTWRGSKFPRYAVISADGELLDTFPTLDSARASFDDACNYARDGDFPSDPDAAPYTVTEAGSAATAYLSARSDYWNAFTDSCRTTADGCPNWDAPEVIGAGIVMEVAAYAYREAGGYLCEACGLLEQCACPDGAPW